MANKKELTIEQKVAAIYESEMNGNAVSMKDQIDELYEFLIDEESEEESSDEESVDEAAGDEAES